MAVIDSVLIDGEMVPPEEAGVSVFDIGFQRGYGCFETMRSYDGHVFRMPQHLDRLEASASMLRMELPSRGDLEVWCADRASEGDVAVKLYVSGGRDATAPGSGSVTVVFADTLPDIAGPARLVPLPAPWHSDGRISELTGAKTLSYAPNIAARLAAVADGFDDALLVGSSGNVLEGPTFSIAWVRDDLFFYPSPDLRVLASVTAAAVVEVAESIGLGLRPGTYHLDDVVAADEVIVMSTLSEVRPVAMLGDATISTGDVARRLGEAFTALVAAERPQT